MRTPASTYRLQITADFDLFEAAARAALPARPRRRLGLPLAAAGGRARQRPRLRRGRPRPRRPVPRRRRGPGRAVGRGAAARAWACSSTSCPTTSASPRPRENAWWWDLLTHGRASRVRRGVRHRLGRRRRPGPHPGRRRRRPARRRRDRAPARSSTASCATTTTASRSRPARRRRRRPDEVHARQHYELVNWRAADDGPELPALLRGQHAGRRPGRGPRGLRRVARRDPALVRRGPRRRAAGRPPRRPARPRGATSTTWPS